ncbi:MAG TPA: FAD-dependent oxidoreductase [Candidatus Dormibacteraeota bacterium]|nr:FAD-dependent oxidoreductase [Candidatus Dormibacteraeota bacterium]
MPVPLRRGASGCLVLALLAAVCLSPPMSPSAWAAAPTPTPPAKSGWDVVVYGATPAGIAAAIAAARGHVKVALLEPTDHIGGMMTSGLGASDVGIRDTIGGLALEFFDRLGVEYRIAGSGSAPSWNFTPGVAERTFTEMLAKAGVTVDLHARLREVGGVGEVDHRITRLTTTDGRAFTARVFVDATYEGDLMAQAGVSFTVGRESSARYGESLAGVGPIKQELPAMDARAPDGSLAPGVATDPLGPVGSADGHVQPYTFRLCVTTTASNQAPFPQPAGYDPGRFLLVARHLQALQAAGKTPTLASVMTLTPLPDQKADLNAAGPLSTDLIGGSGGYPTASYAVRQAIWDEHYRYEAGLLYFLGHDPSVPASISGALAAWGLCRDEFADSNNWPPQLYVREARRMISDVVLTQADLTTQRVKQDSIGLGSYRFDGHPDLLVAGPDSTLYYEGFISAPIGGRYDIPYSILVPKASQVRNLLDPVTVSASHVAFASIRMEPQYMIMGEAAGSAAALAVKSGVDVQRVDIAALHAILRANGVIFRPAAPAAGATQPAPSTSASISQSPVAGSSIPAPAVPGQTPPAIDSGSSLRLLAAEGALVAMFIVIFAIAARGRRRPST